MTLSNIASTPSTKARTSSRFTFIGNIGTRTAPADLDPEMLLIFFRIQLLSGDRSDKAVLVHYQVAAVIGELDRPGHQGLVGLPF